MSCLAWAIAIAIAIASSERASERSTRHIALLRRPKKTENTTVTVTVVGYALVERRRRRGRLSYDLCEKKKRRKGKVVAVGPWSLFSSFATCNASSPLVPVDRPVSRLCGRLIDCRAQSAEFPTTPTVDSRQSTQSARTGQIDGEVATRPHLVAHYEV